MLMFNQLVGFGAATGGTTVLTPSATTFNAADKGSNVVLSNGNLTYTDSTSGSVQSARATTALTAGLWYWEIHVDSLTGSGAVVIGVATAAAPLTSWIGTSSGAWVYLSSSGALYAAASGSGFGAAYTAGDIIGVYMDGAAGKLWFAKNGVVQGGGDPGAGSGAAATALPVGVFPVIGRADGATSSSAVATARFSAASWTATPPSGFNQLP